MRLRHPIALAYLIVAFALAFGAYRIETVTRSTNDVVKNELAQRDAQIKQLNFVLEQQAIPAITFMADEIDRLGGEPPKVLLTPTGPPFVPPRQPGG